MGRTRSSKKTPSEQPPIVDNSDNYQAGNSQRQATAVANVNKSRHTATSKIPQPQKVQASTKRKIPVTAKQGKKKKTKKNGGNDEPASSQSDSDDNVNDRSRQGHHIENQNIDQENLNVSFADGDQLIQMEVTGSDHFYQSDDQSESDENEVSFPNSQTDPSGTDLESEPDTEAGVPELLEAEPGPSTSKQEQRDKIKKLDDQMKVRLTELRRMMANSGMTQSVAEIDKTLQLGPSVKKAVRIKFRIHQTITVGPLV